MTLCKSLTRLRFGLVAALALTSSSAVRAGGVNFGDDDSNASANDGPSYFGFVRDAGGSAVPGARVTASVKTGGAVVTTTNSMGVYKFPGFAKDIDPGSVAISCAKDGFKQVNAVRRSTAGADAKDPIETECYLQKE
jgi:hypothetical protein